MHSEQFSGVFSAAIGVSPHVGLGTTSVNVGLLQKGPTAANIDAGVIVDNPIAGVVDPTGTPTLYLIGDSGHLYAHTTTSDTTVTDKRSGTQITNPAAGIALFQPNGGTKYLYYWQTTQIGRWDLSGSHPTGWTDNQYTGLQSTTIHPTHTFNGAVWYGNKDRIGKLSDDGAAGVTHSTNVLDFPSEYTVTTISDDGNYLVVGITKNTITGNTAINDNKIIYWDGFSPSWNREYPVQDVSIDSIRNIGGVQHILCGTGLFVSTYSTPPKKLFNLDSVFRPNLSGGATYSHYQASVFNDALVWCGNSQLNMYGSPVPGLRKSLTTPIAASANTVIPSTYTKLIIGGKYANLGNAGTGSVSAKTVYFEFPVEVCLERIDVNFGEPLVSGDAMDIDILTDEDTSATDWGSASFATHGAIRTRRMSGSKYLTQVKLVINLTAGNPKIKSITLYGTPTNQ